MRRVLIGSAAVLGLVLATAIGFKVATGRCPIACIFDIDHGQTEAPAPQN